jgi:hypothetical protein
VAAGFSKSLTTAEFRAGGRLAVDEIKELDTNAASKKQDPESEEP